jgi:hypothetical protein
MTARPAAAAPAMSNMDKGLAIAAAVISVGALISLLLIN